MTTAYYASQHASGDGRTILERVETSTSPTADTVIDFESAVRHLRAQGIRDDVTILECLQGAVDEAEKFCNRTFRASVTRTLYYRAWEDYLPIPYPPLQSVTSVKYYDLSDVLQTMSAANYAVQTPTEGIGKVSWECDYVFPNINTDRSDPIQVVCVTGWGSAASIPPLAKTAIRLLCQAAYDGESKARDEAYRVLEMLVNRGRP